MKEECAKCYKVKEMHGKGVCNPCYRRFFWKRKLKECKRCKRMLPIHAKGFCPGCYNTFFYLERTKAQNAVRRYNIDFETYKEITKECIICKFSLVVDLHHIDRNHANTSIGNLVGLCPNHHRLTHVLKHRPEILKILKEKGKCVQYENLPKMLQIHR